MESIVQQLLYNVHVNHLCIISWSVVSTNIALSGPVTRHSQTRRRSHESSSSDKAEGICLPWHIRLLKTICCRLFFLNMDVVTVFLWWMEWKLLFVALIRSCEGIFEGFAEAVKRVMFGCWLWKGTLGFSFYERFIYRSRRECPACLPENKPRSTHIIHHC